MSGRNGCIKEWSGLTDTGIWTPHHNKNAVVVFDNAAMFGLPYRDKSLANSRNLISNAQVEAFIGLVGKLPWCSKATAGEIQSQCWMEIGVTALLMRDISNLGGKKENLRASKWDTFHHTSFDVTSRYASKCCYINGSMCTVWSYSM